MQTDCGSRNLEPAAESPAGTRFCSNCAMTKNSAGGFWKVYANKKNRRWLCKECAERRFR